MIVLGVALALSGLFAIAAGLWLALGAGASEPPAEDDPYRRGLDAAARISAAAWEANQALYQAAWSAREQASASETRSDERTV